MRDDRTTMQVSVDCWQYINERKRPGESMDDVLRRELGIDGDRDEEKVETDGSGEPSYKAGETVMQDAPGSS